MKVKPKMSLYSIIMGAITIYRQRNCPACLTITPYYLDCEVCEGFVVGCDTFSLDDAFLKYLAWLKKDSA